MKGGDLELPPGFRFHPTDEELVLYYLCRKCASMSLAVPIIAEIDLYKYDPWKLPGMALYGEKEWYFFSPRDRKYPNGSRPNRAAGSGYWKATGADKPIGTPNPVGIKKALVFYTGKAPRGLKTNWIMHEYRLANVDRSATARKKNNSRLDEWVLCRIYNKKGVIDDQPSGIDSKKPQIAQPSSFDYSSEDHKPQIAPQHMQMPPPPPPPVTTDVHYFDTSESVPRLQHTDSSCSEHVVSPEFTCEKEVQSEPRWRDWDMQMQLDNNPYDGLQFDDANELSPLQDMFMYLQKPF